MQELKSGGKKLKMFLRFKKILTIITILITIISIFYKMHIDTHNLKINEISLQYKNLPKTFENYKIGFVTDTHLGPATNLKFFNSIIDKLNQYNLDLLLLGGDYIWLKENLLFRYKRNNLYNDIDNKLNAKQIYQDTLNNFSKVRTKDGIIAVYGNHDNWIFPNILNKLAKKSKIKLEKENIIKIKKDSNEILSIYTFQDFWRKLPVIKNKHIKMNKGEFRILLAHNPDTITYINQYFPLKYNLSLSGHTHAGQVVIPFLPKASNTHYKQYLSGLTKINSNSYHYTSAGIGFTSMPFRLNVRPEITIFTLKNSL